MQDALDFCEAHVREVDKDRFLATLFAPKHARGPLHALYAFDAELKQVRDRITSPLPGEVRLQWWRDVLTGTEPGDAAANPIAAGLLQTIARFSLPVPTLLDLIDAHTFDLYDEPMATLAQLENYATATSASIIRLAARILNDGREPGQEAAARHAGMACIIMFLLQHLPLHSARGQRYVPDDVLARHRAMAADVGSGRATQQVRAAMAELRQVARRHMAALTDASVAVPSRLLPAFLPVALVPSALARMQRANADPFRPTIIPQWRRQWTLWRAARHPARFISVAPADPAGTVDRQ
jgi:phytoene synthase